MWLVFIVDQQHIINPISKEVGSFYSFGSWLRCCKSIQIGQVPRVVLIDTLSGVLTMTLAFLFPAERFTL
jgi:uncharacterized membrane protein